MQTLNLDLGERSYPIYIGKGLLDAGERLVAHIPGRRVAVVTNETVAPLYLERLRAQLADTDPVEIILPDGEQYKNLDTLDQVFDALLAARCDRGTTLVALGGGVIGDITGFAAASYMRGVPFIQVPTTLLAQVDSSVGGKTGVNHRRGKNMIGAFYQPRCVLIDTDTLNTLPDRELSAGIAEIIKYGLIRDPGFFLWLEQNMGALLSRDSGALTYAIYTSCRHKAEVVAEDEKEGGVRALLNLGHTFGHAIEAGMGYGSWLHGEAVATGMVMAAELSKDMGWLQSEDVERIEKLCLAAHLPVRAPGELTVERMMDIMAVDKKVEAGQLRLVLMKGIGNAVITPDFDQNKLVAVLERMRQ